MNSRNNPKLEYELYRVGDTDEQCAALFRHMWDTSPKSVMVGQPKLFKPVVRLNSDQFRYLNIYITYSQSNSSLYFLLEQKVPKIQGFRKIWLNLNSLRSTKQGRTSSCSFNHTSFAAVFCFNRFIHSDSGANFSKAGPFCTSLIAQRVI